jgi:hypothetical protein
MTAYRVLVYHGTTNLGDAVQTAALSRLLPGRLVGVYRHLARDSRPRPDAPFVVNGWLGDGVPKSGADCLFAGVFLGRRPVEQLRWLATSRYSLGARDPATAAYLRSNGLKSQTIGCATLTFDRYRGPRAGRLAIDWVHPYTTFLTNCLEAGTSWSAQWSSALRLLDTLRRAAIVYTTRLHVALPCPAFGTPVVISRRAVASAFQPERFSLLDSLGFQYDEPVTIDVTAWADRYVRFLSGQLGRRVRPGPCFNRPEARDR